MKTFSRRKFVETAVLSGVGVTVIPDIARGQKNKEGNDLTAKNITETDLGKTGIGIAANRPDEFSSMRPFRDMLPITVTVGQGEGDLQGDDDIILQAAVDYVANLGGGTVHILPGIYTMSNSLLPREGITIKGSGEKTVLRKNATVTTKIIREADDFEYCVKVEDPKGFKVGGGLALSKDTDITREVRFFTITAIKDNFLFLDKRAGNSYWMMESAIASTRFSIINGFGVDDVTISDIVLDGNFAENDNLDDDYGGAVYMIHCNRWNLNNVIARDFNGDGFSFQVCDDMHFEDCSALNNADLGFHPGSGSQRPVFKRCVSKGNTQGFGWCWGACDGIAEDCVASDNKNFGVNFGHRDTDNIIRNCVIENNGVVGVMFRKEVNEYRSGDRNIIENCIIRDNGKTGAGLGIDIKWKTKDITIRNCKFENSKGGPQKTAVRISQEAENIIMEGNTFSGSIKEVEDKRMQH